jgi:hypothetical protein
MIQPTVDQPAASQAPSTGGAVDTKSEDGRTLAVNLLPPVENAFESQSIVHRWVGADITSYVVTLTAEGHDLATVNVHVKSGESRASFSHLKLNVTYTISVVAMGNVSGDPKKPSRILNRQNPTVTTVIFSGNQNVENSRAITCQVVLDNTVFDGSADVAIGANSGSFLLPGATESASGSRVPFGVWTIAGSVKGYLDGDGAIACFDTPYGVSCDGAGNVYVADSGNLKVRLIDRAGMVSTFGSYSATMRNTVTAPSPVGFEDGLAAEGLGGFLLADGKAGVISRVLPASSSVIAGNGQVGLADGANASASFNLPSGIIRLPGGSIAVADTLNNVVRIVAPAGYTYTWLGNGQPGPKDGSPTSAEFSSPTGMALDRQGNLYICDTGNHLIRKVSTSGYVSTYAGTGQFGDEDGPALKARFDGPTGIAVDTDGTVYVADTNNNCIRRISPAGQVSTFAGSGYRGWGDGPLDLARFNAPSGLALDGLGNLIVADTLNHKIRRIRIR